MKLHHCYYNIIGLLNLQHILYERSFVLIPISSRQSADCDPILEPHVGQIGTENISNMHGLHHHGRLFQLKLQMYFYNIKMPHSRMGGRGIGQLQSVRKTPKSTP